MMVHPFEGSSPSLCDETLFVGRPPTSAPRRPAFDFASTSRIRASSSEAISGRRKLESTSWEVSRNWGRNCASVAGERYAGLMSLARRVRSALEGFRGRGRGKEGSVGYGVAGESVVAYYLTNRRRSAFLDVLSGTERRRRTSCCRLLLGANSSSPSKPSSPSIGLWNHPLRETRAPTPPFAPSPCTTTSSTEWNECPG